MGNKKSKEASKSTKPKPNSESSASPLHLETKGLSKIDDTHLNQNVDEAWLNGSITDLMPFFVSHLKR